MLMESRSQIIGSPGLGFPTTTADQHMSMYVDKVLADEDYHMYLVSC